MNGIRTNCFIWDGFGATQHAEGELGWIHMESLRTDGKYAIARSAIHSLTLISDEEKARLTTWLIDQRNFGVEAPRITYETIEHAKNRRPLPVYERVNRLLRFVAAQASRVGFYVQILQDNYDAYAWSESIHWREVGYFLDYLRLTGLLEGEGFANGGFHGVVTVSGYNRIAEAAANLASDQAFIAMWFHSSMNDAFDDGMSPAVIEAGYSPLKIDQKPDLVKIDDEIIAAIRESRFLVADFTQYKREASTVSI